jgi:hypothetical protein
MAYNAPPTRTTADPVINTDWNTYVKDNFIEVEARKRTDYVESTVSITVSATTAATATTVITGNAFTPSGSDVYRIEFGCSQVAITANAAGNAIAFHLYDGATNLGRLDTIINGSTTGLDTGVYMSREFTPTNASHTYSIRAHRTNANCTVVHGAGGADVAFPFWLRTTRLP